MNPPFNHNKIKWANRWKKTSDFFYMAAQAMTPVAQMPLISLITNPIMNGLWGAWYLSASLAFKYNNQLQPDKEKQERYYQAQSAFNKASYLVGAVATIAFFLTLMPPFWPIAVPILLPIAAIATAVSSVLWTVGLGMDFYKVLQKKDSEKTAGHQWELGSQAATFLYSMGMIVIAALAVAALFTPVGWAAGAGAITFAIAGAAVSVAVFGVAKFCEWRAYKENQKALKVPVLEKPVLPIQKEDQDKIDLGPPHKEILTEFRHELEEAVKAHHLDNKPQTEPKNEKGSEEPPHHREPH